MRPRSASAARRRPRTSPPRSSSSRRRRSRRWKGRSRTRSAGCSGTTRRRRRPAPDQNLAARRKPDPAGGRASNVEWAWAWPANRRILYNRASSKPDGSPWSEKKKWVWWDAAAGKWVGKDVPDFTIDKKPDTPAKPGGTGLDAHSGSDPFVMMTDGRGWLFAPEGLVDGPIPTHYEP